MARRGKWGVWGAGLLLWFAAAEARADEVKSYCLPGQQVGDDCQLRDGEDGVCTDAYTAQCATVTGDEIYTCWACEEDGCSVAHVGRSRTTPTLLVLLAAAGILLRRRQRTPR